MSNLTHKIVILSLLLTCLIACSNQDRHSTDSANQSPLILESDTVYASQKLLIIKVSTNTYKHVSFLNTESWGKVPCNGMLILNNNEAVIFDTPIDNESTSELINFTQSNKNAKILAVVPTHFHIDCIGGLDTVSKLNIPILVNSRTLDSLTNDSSSWKLTANTFNTNHKISIGTKEVEISFIGEGHTYDNCIGYFADDNALFGGCLVKEFGAGKGNLADANTLAWSNTIRSLQEKYPNVKIVIPGHGEHGDTSLLSYTINLFDKTSP